MKRIDVLKGIEKILVEKAYETGHISHRADGDWQKQADGSWTPYTGQSTQSTSQAQEPAPTEFSDLDKYVAKLPNTDLAEDSDEVTNVVAEYLADHGIDDNDDDFLAVRNAIMEKLGGDRYGEITEEDLTETPNDTIYSTEDITATTIDGEDAYEIAGTPVVAMKDPTGKWQVMDGDKIVADGLNTALAHETMVKTMNDKYGFGDSDEEDIFSEEAYAQDEEDRQKMSNYDAIKHIINDNHDYDADIKTIEFRDEGDGELVPHDDDYFRVVDKIWSDNDGFGFSSEDFEDEDSEANELYSNIVDLVTDRAYALRNNEDSKPQERKLTSEEISELVKITDINERKKRQAEMLAQKSAFRDMRSAPAVKNMGF